MPCGLRLPPADTMMGTGYPPSAYEEFLILFPNESLAVSSQILLSCDWGGLIVYCSPCEQLNKKSLM